MTEAYFNNRLQAQGWPMFDSQAPGVHELAVEAWAALQRVYGLGVLETPLQRAPALEERCSDCRVYLKCEHLQSTGSFKVRGATHALKALTDAAAARVGAKSADGQAPGSLRVVTASTGNHARAVLHAAAALAAVGSRVEPLLFLPTTADSGKAAALERAGAALRRAGADCVETEAAARAEAAAGGAEYVSPYNDVRVAGGQGTLGFELLQQLPKLDVVFIPVGGGGLITGIAAALKSLHPAVHVVGCQPRASAVMTASVQAGRLLQDVESADTLSGATAGGIEAGSITFSAAQSLVDEWVTVSEREIAVALLEGRALVGAPVEGAAAVALAALGQLSPRLRGQTVVVLLSGGNLSDEVLRQAKQLAVSKPGERPNQ